MSGFDLYEFRNQIKANKIILSFEGSMSQAVLCGFVDVLNEQLSKYDEKLSDQSINKYIVRRVFAVFVELAQNIQKYSAEFMDNSGIGIIVIRERSHDFIINSGNLINNPQIQNLSERCDQINQMSADELKKFYRSSLKLIRLEGKTGGGVGLIEIARKSGHPIKYNVTPIDQQYSFFVFSAQVDKESC